MSDRPVGVRSRGASCCGERTAPHRRFAQRWGCRAGVGGEIWWGNGGEWLTLGELAGIMGTAGSVPRAPARQTSAGVRGTKGSRHAHVFVGVHERSSTSKGRLALPSPFRDDLGERCYLSLGDDGCVTVRSEESFQAQAAEADRPGPRAARSSRDRKRAFARRPCSCRDRQAGPDHARRAGSREHAGIEQQAAGDGRRHPRPDRDLAPGRATARAKRGRHSARSREAPDERRRDRTPTGFEHRPGDARRDRRHCSRTVPPGIVRRRHPRRRRAQRGAPRATTPQIDVLGLDRDPEALDAATERARPSSATACARAIAALRRARRGARRPRRRRRSAAPCSTSACRHRSSTAPSAASRTATRARSTCAWTPTQPWSAADVVNGYDERELRRRHPPATATSASPDASPGRSSPPGRSSRRPSWRRSSPTAIPAAAAAHGRPSGQAHVPGDPDRGQRRARGAAERARPGDRGHSCPVAASPCSRTTRARTASPRSASPSPPAGASARPSCPACAARSRPCASSAACPSARAPPSARRTAAPRRRGCGSPRRSTRSPMPTGRTADGRSHSVANRRRTGGSIRAPRAAARRPCAASRPRRGRAAASALAGGRRGLAWTALFVGLARAAVVPHPARRAPAADRPPRPGGRRATRAVRRARATQRAELRSPARSPRRRRARHVARRSSEFVRVDPRRWPISSPRAGNGRRRTISGDRRHRPARPVPDVKAGDGRELAMSRTTARPTAAADTDATAAATRRAARPRRSRERRVGVGRTGRPRPRSDRAARRGPSARTTEPSAPPHGTPTSARAADCPAPRDARRSAQPRSSRPRSAPTVAAAPQRIKRRVDRTAPAARAVQRVATPLAGQPASG